MVTVSRCPRDHNIFPALQVERGTRDLFADFKAFRFPSTATVNFVATVQFCQDMCEPVSKENGLNVRTFIHSVIHSFIHSFWWRMQNLTIPCCSQELLPFLSIMYFFLPPFSTNYSSILSHLILPSISWPTSESCCSQIKCMDVGNLLFQYILR